jgi:hypothetical protein
MGLKVKGSQWPRQSRFAAHNDNGDVRVAKSKYMCATKSRVHAYSKARPDAMIMQCYSGCNQIEARKSLLNLARM